MILNVSGRTDIVAFYSEWFWKRYQEGYVDVRNPFYPKQVSRIYFQDVEGIVFCTKNPIPILEYLPYMTIPYYFHVTLTSYKKEIEPGVPRKRDIIEAVKTISKLIGKERIYVRYDPIFLSDTYTLEYHKTSFERICQLLDGYVSHIIVSFIDDYKNVRKNQNILRMRPFTEADYTFIGQSFSMIANKYGMTVQTCSEEHNLVEYGFIVQDCLTKEMAQALTGRNNFKRWTSRNNKHCNCIEMVDIGVYNTCRHFCKYCYANYDEKLVIENSRKHNSNSSLLIGELDENDVVKERKK